jgi:hypothetical protein
LARRPTVANVDFNMKRAVAVLILAGVACTAPASQLTASEAPTPVATPASSATAAAAVLLIAEEAQVWARVRAQLPSAAPVAVPTWMPASVDRMKVQLRALSANAQDPRYSVAYAAANGGEVVLALGPAPDVKVGEESGLGVRVRGVPAVVAFPYSVSTDPAKPALRRVRWQEDGHTLQIASERFSGDDLLHIAWSLDPAGAPAPAQPYTRTKAGACAKPDLRAEDTVRSLVALIGSRDRDAVLDCFASETLGADGTGWSGWADLPRATGFRLDRVSQFAGRMQVQAGWTFESPPGGAWGPEPVNFFVVGLEEGRWRVFYVWTAGLAPLA